MINWEKLFQLGKNYWKKYWEKINKYWHNQYAFSEFATPSCKWGKVVRLQCKSYKFGPLVWGTTCSLISHVFLFLITSLMVHHKNKSNSLETRLWKDISHQTLRPNSYCKIYGLTVKVETKYLLTNFWFGYHFWFH